MWAVFVTLAAIVLADPASASSGQKVSTAPFAYDRTSSASAELIDRTADGWPEQDVRARRASLPGKFFGYDDPVNLMRRGSEQVFQVIAEREESQRRARLEPAPSANGAG
jgi:hypothetical protein